jgi:uncharacterized membrane-anchored protein
MTLVSYDRAVLRDALVKVPAVTLGFWIIKILATTLGETAGDSVTMSWLGETTANPVESGHVGYLIGTGILIVPLILLVAAQVRTRAFHPLLYWATIIASTCAGTTFLGEGTNASYALGSAILLACVLVTLGTWRAVMGTVAVESVREAKAELFYWATITFSQTLGTALGDWTANSSIMGHQIGFTGGALIFGAALAIVACLYFRTSLSRAALFWAAFILTRPLGATVGDFLDKPLAKGGLDFSRPIASLALLTAIAFCLFIFPQRPASASSAH